MRLLDRASRANPTEFRLSLAGALAVLCVISIVAVLLFFSAEETWQLPLRSTRPVSQYLVFCWRRNWMLTNVRQNFAKEAGFCLDCCWRGLKRRQAAEAWLQHPCPFPHWAAVHNTAILYSFAADLYARMLKRIVVVKAYTSCRFHIVSMVLFFGKARLIRSFRRPFAFLAVIQKVILHIVVLRYSIALHTSHWRHFNICCPKRDAGWQRHLYLFLACWFSMV